MLQVSCAWVGAGLAPGLVVLLLLVLSISTPLALRV